MFSIGSFVRSFVCYRPCEHDSLQTNEPILLQFRKSGPRSRSMKHQLWRSVGQSSRSQEAGDIFGGLAEALFSTIWVD